MHCCWGQWSACILEISRTSWVTKVSVPINIIIINSDGCSTKEKRAQTTPVSTSIFTGRRHLHSTPSRIPSQATVHYTRTTLSLPSFIKAADYELPHGLQLLLSHFVSSVSSGYAPWFAKLHPAATQRLKITTSSSTKCTSSCLLLKLLQDCPTLSPLQVASATLGRANLKAKLAQHVTSSGYTRCSSSKPSVTGLSDCFQVDIKRTALCDTLRKLKPSASSKPSALHSGFTTTCTTTCCNRGR